ncbi:MAG: hypothetical protein GY796_23185 [Chloroflexi bacterium]|nr:hypothetical protein [Chloroflexota bacterium]
MMNTITNSSDPNLKKDQTKGWLSCSFMLLAFVLPVVGFIFGVSQWDTEVGLYLAGGIFILLMITAVIIALTIDNLSWLFTFLPALGGLVYTIAPDFIPLPLDDIAILAAGIFFTVVLIVKKVAPPYVLLAVVITGIYAWFGQDLIPGFIDELILFLVMLVLGFVAYHRYQRA